LNTIKEKKKKYLEKKLSISLAKKTIENLRKIESENERLRCIEDLRKEDYNILLIPSLSELQKSKNLDKNKIKSDSWDSQEILDNDKDFFVLK
jgi:hypothetical protein